MNSEFYRQLYETMCDSTNKSVDKQHCLITKQEIEGKNRITLYCGHTFDYYALLKEVYNRKYKIKCDSRITKSKIQCPYCRKLQKGILPYRENDPKYLYVNFPKESAMKVNRCKRMLKQKNKFCDKLCMYEFCTRCKKLTDKHTCDYIMKRGKNKGQLCGKICKNDLTTCTLHTKS